MKPTLHVVAGILYNERDEFLLSTRPKGKAYAGYWEFAGGKVERGETELAALQREFAEELGIIVKRATPYLAKFYRYEHADVHLRFFRIAADDWHGELTSREGQTWAWQRAGDYSVSPMLPANTALLKSLAIARQFSGSLKSGLRGENGYCVAPYSSENSAENVFLTFEQWQKIGTLPEKNSVWVIVENTAQFQAACDADAMIWRVSDANTAKIVLDQLQHGAAIPIVIACPENLRAKFADHWRANGAQAIVLE